MLRLCVTFDLHCSYDTGNGDIAAADDLGASDWVETIIRIIPPSAACCLHLGPARSRVGAAINEQRSQEKARLINMARKASSSLSACRQTPPSSAARPP